MASVKEFFVRFGFVSCAICCFFIPLSSSIMGGAALVCFLCWLLSGGLTSLARAKIIFWPLFFAITLTLLLLISLSYTVAPLADALAVLKKYRELLFLPAMALLLARNHRAAAISRLSFLLGCITLLGLSYAMYFGLIESHKYGFSTVYHITHSFFIAILAFWCLQKILAKKHLFVLIPLFLAAILNLYCIAPGRTGMLIFMVLALLSIWQHFGWEDCCLAIALGFLAIYGTYLASSNFSERFDAAISEVRTYDAQASRTSLGMRFDWWSNSLNLIAEKPIIGHGVGSFATAQQDLIANTRVKPSDNPHNEYLLLAVQAGLIGFFLFIGLLGALFFKKKGLKKEQSYLLQGIVVAMATGCVMNSFLLDSHQGHFFAIISATLLAEAVNLKS